MNDLYYIVLDTDAMASMKTHRLAELITRSKEEAQELLKKDREAYIGFVLDANAMELDELGLED